MLMSLAHFICCTGEIHSFEDGYALLRKQLKEERIKYWYQCGANHVPFEEVLAKAG